MGRLDLKYDVYLAWATRIAKILEPSQTEGAEFRIFSPVQWVFCPVEIKTVLNLGEQKGNY